MALAHERACGACAVVEISRNNVEEARDIFNGAGLSFFLTLLDHGIVCARCGVFEEADKSYAEAAEVRGASVRRD